MTSLDLNVLRFALALHFAGAAHFSTKPEPEWVWVVGCSTMLALHTIALWFCTRVSRETDKGGQP